MRLTEGVEPTSREIARAAIAAMREPTEVMIGNVQWLGADWRKNLISIWRAMIDAALSEDK